MSDATARRLEWFTDEELLAEVRRRGVAADTGEAQQAVERRAETAERALSIARRGWEHDQARVERVRALADRMSSLGTLCIHSGAQYAELIHDALDGTP